MYGSFSMSSFHEGYAEGSTSLFYFMNVCNEKNIVDSVK